METKPKNIEAKRFVSKFAKTLLGATCLTAATGGAAMAGNITFTEGSGGVPSPFSSSQASPTPLTVNAGPPEMITVNGSTNGDSAPAGFFELTGLGTGTFTLSAQVTEGGDTAISVFTDASLGNTLLEGGGGFQTLGPGLFGPDFSNPLNFPSLAIPSDGNLVIEMDVYQEDSAGYTVTVNTAAGSVPEPSTLGMLGLGLAGALTLSRKRRKQ
jgi:PEP-CTERM motif